MTKVGNTHALHEGRTAPPGDVSKPTRDRLKKARHRYEAQRQAAPAAAPLPTPGGPAEPPDTSPPARAGSPASARTPLVSSTALPQTLATFLTTLAPALVSAAPALVAGGMPDSGPALVDLAADELDAFIAELGPALTALQRVVLKRRMDEHQGSLAAVGAKA